MPDRSGVAAIRKEPYCIDDSKRLWSFNADMAINMSPEEEAAIVRLAARIRGARGGASKSPKKQKSSARNARKAIKARIASAA